ncbi:hypothetical protein F5Y16DRAFT_276124 [Xylariaceae sp. FL0255]|nr:hypothetical protein F5Y16DRAFT_276124 [Xylariaceae sp. FL0255]
MTSIATVFSTPKWGKEAEDRMQHRELRDEIPWNYDLFREVLEKYSKIPPEQVKDEIFKIRERAFQVARYPCIAKFSYLRLAEFGPDGTEMHGVIKRLKAPDSQDTFLEIGGFICQTLRRLAFEGVDTTRLYGTDLHDEWFDLGYDLFRDRETMKATFVAGDMLLPDDEYASSQLAKTLNGKITIAHAANFFHLFTLDAQLVICERIARFFRNQSDTKQPAVLFGTHVGTATAGEVRTRSLRSYAHDQKTFQSLWDEVGRRTGTRWAASMRVADIPLESSAFGKDARATRYIVRRGSDSKTLGESVDSYLTTLGRT